MEYDRAYRLARQYLLEHVQPGCEFEIALDDKHHEEVASGWVFFWNSEEFLRTREFGFALVGNGPIYVKRNADIVQLGTADPWQKQIEAL